MTKQDETLLYVVEKGYKVDNAGQVISPKGRQRKIHTSSGKNGRTKYYKSSITINKKVYTVQAHRLQGYQKFKDLVFDKKLQIRHLNGNSLDNSIDNIEIGTASENMLDVPIEVRQNKALIATSKVRKYSESDLKFIFDDRYINNLTYKQLVRKYSVGLSELSFLFNKSLYSKVYSELNAKSGASSPSNYS